MPPRAPDDEKEETWTDEEWRDLPWLDKLKHNFPAWHAEFNGGAAQWWNGRKWCDECVGSFDFEIVDIAHPQRIKPGCTVQPVELRIVKEDSDVGSDTKAV